MRLKKILFLILLPLFSLAASYQGEIFIWGYGELIKDILEAIRALVDSSKVTLSIP